MSMSRRLAAHDLREAFLAATHSRIDLHPDHADGIVALLTHGTDSGNFFDAIRDYCAGGSADAEAAAEDLLEAILIVTDGSVRPAESHALDVVRFLAEELTGEEPVRSAQRQELAA